MYSANKNHCAEAIKAVTLLLGKILSPPKAQVLYFSNVKTLFEAVYLPVLHLNDGYSNVSEIVCPLGIIKKSHLAVK